MACIVSFYTEHPCSLHTKFFFKPIIFFKKKRIHISIHNFYIYIIFYRMDQKIEPPKNKGYFFYFYTLYTLFPVIFGLKPRPGCLKREF